MTSGGGTAAATLAAAGGAGDSPPATRPSWKVSMADSPPMQELHSFELSPEDSSSSPSPVRSATTLSTPAGEASPGRGGEDSKRRGRSPGTSSSGGTFTTLSSGEADLGASPDAAAAAAGGDGRWQQPGAAAGGTGAKPMEQCRSDIEDQHLKIEGVIGGGGHGTVYNGTWRDLEVAIKTVVFEVRPSHYEGI